MPYSMKLGRGRVTDEGAAVELLSPDHVLMTEPHRIGDADFNGWVQERGLYFAETWDEAHVTPLLSMSEPGLDKSDGSAPERGSLVVADHGKGRVVYVGLSLFRQIPAGVPGAYRLLANLLHRRGDSVVADSPPPILGRWSNLYVIVVLVLALLILGFYLLRRRYGT
jgi:hypothetical protein